MKRILIAMAIALSAAFVPLQASAQVNLFNIIVPTPPPAPVVEAIPAARPGYLWAPGYWSWNSGKHVWTDGHWERVREGQRYERTEWRRDGDNWRLKEGGWKKAKKHKKHKHDDDDHDEGHHDNDRHDNRGGGFCPLGQAKKGNC